MRYLWLVLSLCLIVGCNGEDEATPTTTMQPEATATEMAAPLPTGYPANGQPDVRNPYPEPTALLSLPRATPTPLAAYQGLQLTWIQKAAGMQCNAYTLDLTAARSELERAGIQVVDSQLSILPVCDACDVCPSSEHYQAFIPAEDVNEAIQLGWAYTNN